MYRNFDELISALQNDTTKRRCAVASAADKHTLEAVVKADLDGIIEPVLIGDEEKIITILREMGVRAEGFEIIHADSEEDSAQIACDLVNQGKASAIMKGLMETSTIMRAVLKKENNLRAGGLLSAVSLLEIPGYHKLLLTTDPGLNMYPDVDGKQQIIENAVALMRGLGVECPKVAVLAAVEVVNPKMQATVDAAELKRRNQAGEIKNCLVDGPLSFDIAMSEKAAKIKKLDSPVAGDPDIIVYPNIDVGNIAGKALVYSGGAKSAAIMVGARVPIINTSRSLSVDGKCRAIALAVACGVLEA